MASDPQSAWVTVVQVGAAALSPVIAIVGGWIAWQQVRLNRNKLKLDRFEKRFAIHEAAMAFVAAVCTNGVASDAQMNEFLVKTRGTRFLVNTDVAGYLEELYRNAGRLRAIKMSMEASNLTDEKRVEYGDKWLEFETWFQKQLDVIPEKFAPFLSVDDI
jgi:hypothetical protein